MKKIYKILPVFTDAIWGGQQLIEKYGYKTDLNNIGECYNVIAMPNHLDCTVEETGEFLSTFYENNKDLFGSNTAGMPVRAAMSCTCSPMSVQLHPSNAYALEHDGCLGKPDGVYIIDGEGTVEFGHNAKSRKEFREMAEEGRWDQLLRYVHVNKGDFLDMPQGTLHALGAGMTYFEFSQNADLTYRIFDYNRKRIDPKTGKPRTMHTEKVIECVNIPNQDVAPAKLTTVEKDGIMITEFHNEPGVYTCGKLEVNEKGVYTRKQFYFLTCIEGEGNVNGVAIKGGETLFVPCDFGSVEIVGNCTLTYVTYLEK